MFPWSLYLFVFWALNIEDKIKQTNKKSFLVSQQVLEIFSKVKSWPQRTKSKKIPLGWQLVEAFFNAA